MSTRTISNPTLAVASLSLALGFGLAGTACKKAEAKVKGVGDTLKAFIVTNCETGDRYCQVCAYGGRPTIMAVGDIDDAAFEQDLAQIQGLVAANGDKELTAFALYGKIEGGKFAAVADEAAAQKKLAALTKKLGLTFPVTLAPKALTEKEAKDYTPFTDAYEISKSRTVMLAGAGNDIRYAETMSADAKAQHAALASAGVAATGGQPPPVLTRDRRRAVG